MPKSPNVIRAARAARRAVRNKLIGRICPWASVKPVVADYGDVIGGLVARRVALGLSQVEAEALIGLSDGNLGHLEASHRIARADLLMLWARGLGCRLALIETGDARGPAIRPPERREPATRSPSTSELPHG